MNRKKNTKGYYFLACSVCKKRCDERKSHTGCPVCGEPLEAVFDYDRLAEHLNVYDIKNAAPSTMKYLNFFPLKDFREAVSLKEGGTPLYKAEKLGAKFGLKNLYVKNEGANPTR